MIQTGQPEDVSQHGMWRNRWIFILAATGSAVGLGNIWRFPYITGENGGGAFIVVYLASVLLLGIPIMISEVMLGRAGRHSPVLTMRRLAKRAGAHPVWVFIGWNGMIAGCLILSYYEVIAGWTLNYAYNHLAALFSSTAESAPPTLAAAQGQWEAFLADPWRLILCQTLFVVITVAAIARGVNKGLEVVIIWSMPTLFILLLGLVAYSVSIGDMAATIDYIFRFNWDALSIGGVLAAVGQAFFTLSIGMGAMMTYGAYLPANTSIPGAVAVIALLDTLVAVLAGLVIFPIVFLNGLAPVSGPGLLFVTLSHAFNSMAAGAIVGMLFFALVAIAALTSLISLTEPVLSWLVEKYNAKRWRVAISIGVICWLLGLGTVFSFNEWQHWHPIGTFTFFELLDYLTANILLPLGGFFIVIFAGWVLPEEVVQRQLALGTNALLCWRIATRLIAPIGVLLIFSYTLYRGFAG